MEMPGVPDMAGAQREAMLNEALRSAAMRDGPGGGPDEEARAGGAAGANFRDDAGHLLFLLPHSLHPY